MSDKNLGKKVTWGLPEKTGTIVAFVPAGESLDVARKAMSLPAAARLTPDRSLRARYIVRSDEDPGLGPKKFYAPRAAEIDERLGAAAPKGTAHA